MVSSPSSPADDLAAARPGVASKSGAGADVVAVLRARGLVAQLTHEAPLAAFLAAAPRAFYIGYDPTAASLHAGHLVTLMAARHLARAGHRPILLVGGATARVGDPSGKTQARPELARAAVARNAAALREQMERIVSHEAAPTLCDNAEWLGPMGALDFLSEVGRHFPVSRMLTAQTYRSRLASGLTFFEFSYQLLQAHDFSELGRRHGCRLQVGGDDQWSNILGGVELCRRRGQPQAFGLTVPLIEAANGAKMGKSVGGAVWLDPAQTSPNAFYQYWVNTADSDILRFVRLLTDLPLDEIAAIDATSPAALNASKSALAWEVTALVHGREAADAAHGAARGAFGERSLPADVLASSAMPRTESSDVQAVPAHRLAEAATPLIGVLVALGWAKSNNEARRLIAQGGVVLDEKKVSDVNATLQPSEWGARTVLLRAGKKRVVRLLGP